MSVKTVLLGIEFEKKCLVYTAGDKIHGQVFLNGGARGNKIYDLKLTLLRTTDYVFADQLVDRAKSLKKLNHFITKMNCTTCATYAFDKVIPLPSGQTTALPFAWELPTNLSSSIVVQNGFSWYGLMLSGRSQSQHGSLESFILKKDVMIIGLVPGPKEGFTEPFKNMAKFTGAGETSKMMVKMSQTWVLSGAELPFAVAIWNGTKVPFPGVKASLQQNITYNFKARRRTGFVCPPMRPSEAHVIWQEEGPEVPQGTGDKVIWKGVVKIPYVLPSGLGSEGCPNFNIQYVLQFAITKFTNLKIQVPIHIGTASSDSESSELSNYEDISLQYGLGLSQSLGGSLYSLDWDTASLSSMDSGVWSLTDDASGGS